MSYNGSISFDIDPKVLRTLPKIEDSLEDIIELLAKLQPATKPAKTGFQAFTDTVNGSVSTFSKAASTYKDLVTQTKDKSAFQSVKELGESFVNLGKSAGQSVVSTLAQKAALDVQTTSTIATTVAQQGLNLAMKALPVLSIIQGVMTLVGCLASLIGQISSTDDALKEHNDHMQELDDKSQEIKEHNQDAAESYKETLYALSLQSTEYERLISKVFKLSEIENKSAKDKQQLSFYVGQLNDKLGDLNLQYNKEQDALSLNEQQVRNYLKAKDDIAKYDAAMERQNSLYKDRADT